MALQKHRQAAEALYASLQALSSKQIKSLTSQGHRLSAQEPLLPAAAAAPTSAPS